ncbi:MAG: class I SAM-dependent methyltransferase [Pseudomonadota bacterium]
MADTAQFYTGLIAELYEPLAGSLVSAAPIKRFVQRYGTPALELACGAGHPMLDLLSDGLQVHGVDSSMDMLDLCRSKGADMGLQPTLFCQRMQDLALAEQYRCCYFAGASFCLLDDIDDACATLAAVHRHIQPGGAFLISLFRPQMEKQPSQVRRKIMADGTTGTVRSIAQSENRQQQTVTTTLRYTHEQDGKLLDAVERDWLTRWYTVKQMTDLLEAAGFDILRCTDYDGAAAEPSATDFSVVALAT